MNNQDYVNAVNAGIMSPVDITPELEVRILPQAELRLNQSDDQPSTVEGYGAVWNSDSHVLSSEIGPFIEQFAPGAFSWGDVRALYNHDSSQMPYARLGAGTLALTQDDKGLKYRFSPADSPRGKDLLAAIQRGDINQSSVGFFVDKDKWTQDGQTRRRTILKATLIDVSPVQEAAYPSTSVSVRSFNKWQREAKAAKDALAATQQELTDTKAALDEANKSNPLNTDKIEKVMLEIIKLKQKLVEVI